MKDSITDFIIDTTKMGDVEDVLSALIILHNHAIEVTNSDEKREFLKQEVELFKHMFAVRRKANDLEEGTS